MTPTTVTIQDGTPPPDVRGALDFSVLVEPTRVHGSLYTRPDIFNLEMERLFQTGWVFLGHESELPDPGDFITRRIGGQPIIVARGRDGAISAMYNRCSHRGNLVCRADSGNERYLHCPYHGWTFGSDGSLMGVPQKTGYGERSKELTADLGLAQIGELDSYGGFLFGQLTSSDTSLTDHLGGATESIDRLLELSPNGQVDLNLGWVKHRIRANWKTIVENQVDGYHARYVHQSVYSAIAPARVDYGAGELQLSVRDLGGGHSDIDYRDEYRRLDREFGWFGQIERGKVPAYAAALEQTHGADKAHDVLLIGPPHTVIFPSLFIAELNLMMFEPVGPEETIVHTTPICLSGAPEMNERIRRRAEGAMGPSGFLIADDADMGERTQLGLAAGEPEWIELSRGIDTDEIVDGQLINHDESAETSQRAFWRHYSTMMLGASR